jgi:hypothetical protein
VIALRRSTRYYRKLFRDYPAAAETIGHRQEMTLIGSDGQLARLTQSTGFYVLQPRHLPLRKARRMVPVPADGQFYGLVDYDRNITALISVYNPYDGPEGAGENGDRPVASVMPREGLPSGRWPVAVPPQERFWPWFWQMLRAGRIIHLDQHFASKPALAGAVIYPGGHAIMVLTDLDFGGGLVLPGGTYADVELLNAGLPDRDALFADGSWADLAACFSGPSQFIQAVSTRLADQAETAGRQPV